MYFILYLYTVFHTILNSIAIFLFLFDVNFWFFFMRYSHVATILNINIMVSSFVEIWNYWSSSRHDNVKSISHDRVSSCSLDICGALNRQRLRSAILENSSSSNSKIGVRAFNYRYKYVPHDDRLCDGYIISENYLVQAKLTSNNGLHARDANTLIESVTS